MRVGAPLPERCSPASRRDTLGIGGLAHLGGPGAAQDLGGPKAAQIAKGAPGSEATRFPQEEGARAEAVSTERNAMIALRAVDTACRAGAPPQGGRAAANKRIGRAHV